MFFFKIVISAAGIQINKGFAPTIFIPKDELSGKINVIEYSNEYEAKLNSRKDVCTYMFSGNALEIMKKDRSRIVIQVKDLEQVQDKIREMLRA